MLDGGFKDNSWIEVTHCNTKLPASTDLSGVTIDTQFAEYGRWFYYARGTGMYMNIGKTIVARNKVHALLLLNNLPNTMAGFTQLVSAVWY